MALTRRFSLLIRRLLPNPETVHRPRHAASCAGERSSDRAWRPRRHARLLPRHLRLPHLLMRGRQPDECLPDPLRHAFVKWQRYVSACRRCWASRFIPRDPQPPSPRRGTSGRRRVARRVAACPARRRRPCCGRGRHERRGSRDSRDFALRVANARLAARHGRPPPTHSNGHGCARRRAQGSPRSRDGRTRSGVDGSCCHRKPARRHGATTF